MTVDTGKTCPTSVRVVCKSMTIPLAFHVGRSYGIVPSPLFPSTDSLQVVQAIRAGEEWAGNETRSS